LPPLKGALPVANNVVPPVEMLPPVANNVAPPVETAPPVTSAVVPPRETVPPVTGECVPPLETAPPVANDTSAHAGSPCAPSASDTRTGSTDCTPASVVAAHTRVRVCAVRVGNPNVVARSTRQGHHASH